MPNYYTIRKCLDSSIPDTNESLYDEYVSLPEVSNWIEAACSERYLVAAPNNNNGWLPNVVIDWKNTGSDNLQELANMLKYAFEQRFYRENDLGLPYDPNATYNNAKIQLDDLQNEYYDSVPPAEAIIAIICNAELLVKNPYRTIEYVMPANQEQEIMIENLRSQIDNMDRLHKERNQNEENIHDFLPLAYKPKKGSIPNTQELLHWVDECELLTNSIYRNPYKFTDPATILQQIEIKFEGKGRVESVARAAQDSSRPVVKRKKSEELFGIYDRIVSLRTTKNNPALFTKINALFKDYQQKKQQFKGMSILIIVAMCSTMLAIRSAQAAAHSIAPKNTMLKSALNITNKFGRARTVKGFDLSGTEKKLKERKQHARSNQMLFGTAENRRPTKRIHIEPQPGDENASPTNRN
jgi:hypothetical protein